MQYFTLRPHQLSRLAESIRSRSKKDRVDRGIDEFRAELKAGMKMEWRDVHGKRMLVKVYPAAAGLGIGPKVDGKAMFGRRTR